MWNIFPISLKNTCTVEVWGNEQRFKEDDAVEKNAALLRQLDYLMKLAFERVPGMIVIP